MKSVISLILLSWLTLMSFAQTTLQSPDGKYLFSFNQDSDRLTYTLSFGSRPVTSGELGVDIDNHLVESAMGIPVDTNHVWTAGLTLTGVTRCSRDTVWQPVYGEYSSIRDCYNEMTLHFAKGKATTAQGLYRRPRKT